MGRSLSVLARFSFHLSSRTVVAPIACGITTATPSYFEHGTLLKREKKLLSLIFLRKPYWNLTQAGAHSCRRQNIFCVLVRDVLIRWIACVASCVPHAEKVKYSWIHTSRLKLQLVHVVLANSVASLPTLRRFRN